MNSLPEIFIRRWLTMSLCTVGATILFLIATQTTYFSEQNKIAEEISNIQRLETLLYKVDGLANRLSLSRDEVTFKKLQTILQSELQKFQIDYAQIVEDSETLEAFTDTDSLTKVSTNLAVIDQELKRYIPLISAMTVSDFESADYDSPVSHFDQRSLLLITDALSVTANEYKNFSDDVKRFNIILRLSVVSSAIFILFLVFWFALRKLERQVISSFDALTRNNGIIEKEKELLSATVSAINQGITLFDEDSILRVANDKFYRLLQIPRKDFPIGSNSRDIAAYLANNGFFKQDSNDKTVDGLYDYLDTEKAANFEAKHANGKVFAIHYRALDKGGHLLVYTDITNQRIAERWTESMNNQITTVIDATEELGVGIAFLDEENNFIVSNRVYHSLLDPSEFEAAPGHEETSTKSVADNPFGDSHIEAMPKFLAEQIEQKIPTHEYVRTNDSRIISVSLAGFEQGTGLVICIDVTERRRSEKKLRDAKVQADIAREQSEDAYYELRSLQNDLIQAEKMAALGRLVAGVAHEINTPIGNTLTTTTVMRQKLLDIEGKLDAKELRTSHVITFLKALDEGLQISETNIDRAHELIQSFKQVAADQTSSVLREVNLKQLVSEIVVSVKPQFKNTDHQIEFEIPDDINLTTYPGPLQQIFTNLLTNAVVHGFEHRSDGTINIEAAQDDAENITILVSDNGCGIPTEFLDKIYDPFFTTKRGRGGTGLGLNIVYSIVRESLRGSIRVKETSEGGTTFALRLPKAIDDTADSQ